MLQASLTTWYWVDMHAARIRVPSPCDAPVAGLDQYGRGLEPKPSLPGPERRLYANSCGGLVFQKCPCLVATDYRLDANRTGVLLGQARADQSRSRMGLKTDDCPKRRAVAGNGSGEGVSQATLPCAWSRDAKAAHGAHTRSNVCQPRIWFPSKIGKEHSYKPRRSHE